MSKVLTDNQHYSDIADAIRAKLGTADTYFPSEMAAAVESISGGSTPVIQPLSVTENGIYTAPSGVDGYSPVTVNVSGGGALQEKTVSLLDILQGSGQNFEVLPDSLYDGMSKVIIHNPGRYAWTEYSKFLPEGLSASGWASTDGTKNISLVSGAWDVSDGKLICDGDRYRFAVPNSNVLVQCRCSIAGNFSPVNPSYWYGQSCIFGCELSGGQRDYGVTLPYNTRTPSIGYASGNPKIGSISVDSNEHLISLLHTGSVYYLYIDGVLSASQSYTASGTHLSSMGLFWNNDSSNTVVKGNISALGVWTFSTINSALPIFLPSLE